MAGFRAASAVKAIISVFLRQPPLQFSAVESESVVVKPQGAPNPSGGTVSAPAGYHFAPSIRADSPLTVPNQSA